MTTNKNGPGTPASGQPMSRAAFIGTGAGAALGVAATGPGLPGMSPGRPPLEDGPGPAPSPPSALTWSMPAGILNALWSDFFPRLIGVTWHDDLVATLPPVDLLTEGAAPFIDAAAAGAPPTLRRGVAADGMLELLVWLKERMDRNEAPGKDASTALKQRLDRVIGFFEAHKSATGSPFPLFVAGAGGYDFLLSEWGIEFFVPDSPQKADDLLRYYAFRQTGRPSLGIPTYLDNAVSLVSIDAPTGPSQIEVDPTVVVVALRLAWSDAEAARLMTRWGITRARWETIQEAMKVWRGDPARVVPGTDRLFPRGRGPRPTGLAFDEYACALGSLRSWKVEGSVYRGIAVELPRIVANAWLERPDRIQPPPSMTLPLPGNSYRQRFADPGDDGLRGLFRERLETMLPTADRMVCRTGAPAACPGDPLWNADDVMITNQGFYFPVLSPEPNLRNMLAQIAQGRAGNPVFTDSKRPDRGG